MIRVLLVDDHSAFREPFALLLDQEPDFEVVATAGSLCEARDALQATPRGIDLAVLDLDLPDGLGTDLIEDLRAKSPQAMSLVLTGLSERTQLALAIEAGVAGVIGKTSRVDEIVRAARKLCAGEPILTPQEVVEALRLTSHVRREESEARAKLGKLTPREREVLEVLAEGLGDKEIAERLHVGLGTVRSHVESILAKLEVASRLQALVFAVRHDAVKISQILPKPGERHLDSS
ncbi:MAG: response regulator transcription factor [Rubrobacteraceae bacterium]|nr:response regulator transcription factor [Rubrobacteraceae bacterium]